MLDRVDSTMDELWRRIDVAEEGAVVIAEEQTGGRGRFDRVWLAPHGSSITCSILFRPPIDGVGQVPMLLGIAACEAIEVATVASTTSG